MAICDESNRDHASRELEQLLLNRDNNKSSPQNSRQQQNGSCSSSCSSFLAPPSASIPAAPTAVALVSPQLQTPAESHSSPHHDGKSRQNQHQHHQQQQQQQQQHPHHRQYHGGSSNRMDPPSTRSPTNTPGHRRTRYDSDNSSSSGGFSSSSGAARRKTRRPPPDGGWGWIVVLASFAVNLISDGVSLSFGLFLPDLTSYFAVGKGHAAWVASLFLSMPLLAGPVASWLTDRYGCRRVCIAGSLLAALGFIFSFFSNSLALLYVTFSLAGFGLALCYVTSIVIVAYYFEKKRCLATGLSVCGTGVGTFIFAPLTYLLVEVFMWRGTLLILAGFFLNMVVSGALMRDLDVQDGEDGDDENHPGQRSPSPTRWGFAGHLAGGRRMCSSLLQLPTYLSDESPRLPEQVLTEMSSKEKGHLSTLLKKYPNLWNDVLKNNPNDDPYLTVKSSPMIKTILENRTLEELPPSSPSATLESSLARNPLDPERTITFTHWSGLSLLTSLLPYSGVTDHTETPLSPRPIVKRDANNSLSAGAENHDNSVPFLQDVPPVGGKRQESNSYNNKDQHQHQQQANNSCSSEHEAFNKKDTIVALQGASLIDRSSSAGRYGCEGGNGTARNSLACATAASTTKKSSSLRQHRQASFGPLSLPRDRANSAAYLRNLRLQRGSLTYRGAMLNIKRYRLKASSCPNIYRNSMATINESESSPCEFFKDLKDVVCDMMDVRLLTNFKYALFCLSNFLLNACVDNPYVYIPDHAASLPSIQEGSGAFIISIVGVLNTLGVVIVGYVGDKPWIDPSLLYALCTIVAGASVATIPLFSSYLPLATASAIYGFTISANYTLVPEIVVNLISLDNFTGAYGLLLLIQGIAGLIGPPIAGWLYDISGSYNTTFYISGLSILASGVLVIPVAQTWKCACKTESEDGCESDLKDSHSELRDPETQSCLGRKHEVLSTGPPPSSRSSSIVINGVPLNTSVIIKNGANGYATGISPSLRSPGSPSKANQVRFSLRNDYDNDAELRAPLATPDSP